MNIRRVKTLQNRANQWRWNQQDSVYGYRPITRQKQPKPLTDLFFAVGMVAALFVGYWLAAAL